MKEVSEEFINEVMKERKELHAYRNMKLFFKNGIFQAETKDLFLIDRQVSFHFNEDKSFSIKIQMDGEK